MTKHIHIHTGVRMNTHTSIYRQTGRQSDHGEEQAVLRVLAGEFISTSSADINVQHLQSSIPMSGCSPVGICPYFTYRSLGEPHDSGLAKSDMYMRRIPAYALAQANHKIGEHLLAIFVRAQCNHKIGESPVALRGARDKIGQSSVILSVGQFHSSCIGCGVCRNQRCNHPLSLPAIGLANGI